MPQKNMTNPQNHIYVHFYVLSNKRQRLIFFLIKDKFSSVYQFHISVLRFLALFSNYFFEKELFCFSKTPFSKQIFSSYRNIFSDFLSYGNYFFYFSSYGSYFFRFFILWELFFYFSSYGRYFFHIFMKKIRSTYNLKWVN